MRHGSPSRHSFFFRFCCLLLFAALPGCAVLFPSSGEKAGNFMAEALGRGDAVVITYAYASEWQRIDVPDVKVAFAQGERHFGVVYTVHAVRPGTYVFVGGTARPPEGVQGHMALQGVTGETFSSRLGSAEYTNTFYRSSYKVRSFTMPTYGTELDKKGVPRQVEKTRGEITEDTRYSDPKPITRVKGAIPGLDAAGKPLLAAFTVEPGEIVFLQPFELDAITPDTSRCRRVEQGVWTCPVKSLAVKIYEADYIETCKDEARKSGVPPDLARRFAYRKLTLGSLWREPHAQTPSRPDMPPFGAVRHVFEEAATPPLTKPPSSSSVSGTHVF